MFLGCCTCFVLAWKVIRPMSNKSKFSRLFNTVNLRTKSYSETVKASASTLIIRWCTVIDHIW